MTGLPMAAAAPAGVPLGEQAMLDRRWSTVLEQAMATHADIRLALRLAPPTGLR